MYRSKNENIVAIVSRGSLSSVSDYLARAQETGADIDATKPLIAGNKDKNEESLETKIAGFIAMFLFSLFLGIYVGSEVGYGSYIDTFCTDFSAIHCSSSTGRYMTSVYWGSLSFGRLVSVLLIKRISAITMLVWDLIGCVIACVIFILFNDKIIFIWIATAIYGCSMGSPFPAIFLVAESTVQVSGKLASVMVFGASVGEFVIPYSQGIIMDKISISTFIGITFVTTLAMIVVLFAIVCVKKQL